MCLLGLHFENIKNFVDENNITRPKMGKKLDGRRFTRDKSSRMVRRKRATRSSCSSHTKTKSDTDGSDKKVCHSPQGRLRHRRYRLKRNSKPMDSKSDKREFSADALD